METFAEKLKRMRAECAMSQEELAKKIYVSRSAIAKWEQGRGFPSVASLQCIAAEFAVTIDELVSEKEIAILEIEKDKKLSVRTKLLISVSAIFGALIIIGAILLGMFCPRRLSNYIDLEVEDIDEIYISYATAGGNSKQVYLDDNKTEVFLDCIYNTKVVPEYIHYKVTTMYDFRIISGENKYILDSLGVSFFKNGEWVKTKKFYIYSGSFESLMYLFDIPEEDMKYI